MEQRSDAVVVARLAAGQRPADSEQWWQRVRRWRELVLEALTQPLYSAYEHRILLECLQRPPPEKLDTVLDWCGELAISAVTLWVCSTDNLNRPADEVAGILSAVEAKLRALTEDPQIHRRRVRVQAIGRLDLLPASTAAAIRAAQDATSHYEAMTLTIAIAYGGREEIVDSVRAVLCEAMRDGATLAEAIERVDTNAIGKNLYLSPGSDPDLIIRTSGEVRLSGFLLWQSAYSEFYFTDVHWPALRKIDFLRAVRSFQDRKRRFGR
jgi:short-chain Z-isoprenyl diphosphate synthase